jgi:hypothetical protein
MKDRIERLKHQTFWNFNHELREILMAFADSIAKLQVDVANLIAADNGSAAAVASAVSAAVAVKDAADATMVDALDATIVAALAPAAPAAPAV